MTIDVFTASVVCVTVLLFVWWGLDRWEDSRQAAREQLARDVRQRQRMRAVVSITEHKR